MIGVSYQTDVSELGRHILLSRFQVQTFEKRVAKWVKDSPSVVRRACRDGDGLIGPCGHRYLELDAGFSDVVSALLIELDKRGHVLNCGVDPVGIYLARHVPNLGEQPGSDAVFSPLRFNRDAFESVVLAENEGSLPVSLDEVKVRRYGHAMGPGGCYDFVAMQSYQEDVAFFRVEMSDAWWRQNEPFVELLGEQQPSGRVLLLVSRRPDLNDGIVHNQIGNHSRRIDGSDPCSGFPSQAGFLAAHAAPAFSSVKTPVDNDSGATP